MNGHEQAAERSHGRKPEQVRITVNEQFVVLGDKHQTGASIKAAAIEQGVSIEADWVLSEVRPNGHQRVVPDDKPVTLQDGDDFWAIPGDDNS